VRLGRKPSDPPPRASQHEHVGILSISASRIFARSSPRVGPPRPGSAFQERATDLLRKRDLRLGDGQELYLNRSQPHREIAPVVLIRVAKKRSIEPRSARWIMNTGAPAVRSHVLHVEPARQVEVELDGGALPAPSDRVGELDVDLGTVEYASPPRDGIQPEDFTTARARLGQRPLLVRAM